MPTKRNKSSINPYINLQLRCSCKEVKGFLSTFFCLLAHQSNPRFGGGFPIGYETGVNFPEIRYQLSIGEYAIIGAGAVVNKNVPDNVMVAGVPAKIKKQLDFKKKKFDFKILFDRIVFFHCLLFFWPVLV